MIKIFLKIQIEVKMISAFQNFHFAAGIITSLSYITVAASLVLTLPSTVFPYSCCLLSLLLCPWKVIASICHLQSLLWAVLLISALTYY